MIATRETYSLLRARADDRSQRRFRKALDLYGPTGQWDPVMVALYLQAEALIDRLEEIMCPLCGTVPPMSEYGFRYTCECYAGRERIG